MSAVWTCAVDRHDPPRVTAGGELTVFPKGTRDAFPVATHHDAAYLDGADQLPDAHDALYVIDGRPWYVAAYHPDKPSRVILHPLPDDAGRYFPRPARVYLLTTIGA